MAIVQISVTFNDYFNQMPLFSLIRERTPYNKQRNSYVLRLRTHKKEIDIRDENEIGSLFHSYMVDRIRKFRTDKAVFPEAARETTGR
jgi:hypothetical protein